MLRHRIITLLPSATEVVFALGAGERVVGVTHECDFPPEAATRKHCTANLLPPNLSAREIDQAVSKSLKEDPHSIYRLDTEVVRKLEPTVIVTQRLCPVCAVPEKAVLDFTCTLPYTCKVVSSDPHTLEELFESIFHIANAIDEQDSAVRLVDGLKLRLSFLRSAIPSAPRPRVIVLEWPDPPYAPGHWVPDMIEAAGGICALGASGEKSKRVTWEHLCGLDAADIVVTAFCGYHLIENERECDKLKGHPDWIKFTASAKVYASDASSYFSRPGNRLIDGTELLAYIIHGTPSLKPKAGCASLQLENGWEDISHL